MLSFFKFPFSSRKPRPSDDNHDHVLLDILRKRRQDRSPLSEEQAKQLMDKYRGKLNNYTDSKKPEAQYEAMKKILQDLDNELH